MEGSRFDAWTRRRFGLVTGGALASLLGMASLHEADARRRRKKKKKKGKKKTCRKLGESCDINKRNMSCCDKNGDQDCGQVQNVSGNVCCKEHFASCKFNEDCCGTRRCSNGSCR